MSRNEALTSMQLELESPPLPARSDRWALLIDIDGTLVDFAPHPDDVRLGESTRQLLGTLFTRLDGAVAILSGRNLSDIDRLLHPLMLPAGALHGIERRGPDGRISTLRIADDAVVRAHAACVEGIANLPGVWIESKAGPCLAIHFRGAPQYASIVHELAHHVAAQSNGQLHVQAGNGVAELKPPGRDKGTALRAFLDVAPFRGRRPIVVGDDLTDETAFAEALRFNGFGVLVGASRPTVAAYALPTPATTIDWLQAVADAHSPGDAIA
jgi:trehalose 6-phosphate phosphatase